MIVFPNTWKTPTLFVENQNWIIELNDKLIYRVLENDNCGSLYASCCLLSSLTYQCY